MTSWSRREQNQAYRFVTRRIVGAILFGEPETSELPMRRFMVTLFGSAGIAILIIAGFLVYGLLVPGGGRPIENVIIVERETGANYIYVQGRLHSVLNWTSARLILGQAQPPVRTMSRNSLRDVPRGRAVGIPGLPDTLPDKKSLIGLPWSVCSAPASPNSVELATHVLAGRVPGGGVPLGDNEGLLVSEGRDRFLIWHSHRLRIRDNSVIAVLGWAGLTPTPVSRAFLDAVPPGPDLASPPIPNAGSSARVAVAGESTDVGDLFRASDQHYLMLRDGLTPIGALTARLLVADGRPVTEVSATDVGRVLLTTPVEPPGMPQQIPAVGDAADQVVMACAVYRGAAEIDQPVVVESFAAVDDELARFDPAASGIGPRGRALADRVLVAGGRGALVEALMPSESAARGDVYVVTDQGVKYPVPRGSLDQVQTSLGYDGVDPIVVPDMILDLIPTGPALDPAAATIFADPDTVDPVPQPSDASDASERESNG